MTSPAVSVESLQKVYRRGFMRKPFEALKGVSFQVQRGEIFGLLGPNGAGKTTLIKVLLGIIRKSGGAANLLDRPAGNSISRTHVGYLPENLRIARHHTARTALEYYGKLSGLSKTEIRERSPKLLESVGLLGRERDSIKQYSKGMLQRLGLAQALMHDPELLILDEPTDGLDPVGRSHVRRVLNELKQQGKTIFLNSHILQEVELVCDRVAVLNHGKLRAIGRVDELATRNATGVELLLTLVGDKANIQSALSAHETQQWETSAEGQHRLRLRLADQNSVDGCIDALRQRQVSIIGLARHRLSLEDAFMQLLSESEEPVEEVAEAAVVVEEQR